MSQSSELRVESSELKPVRCGCGGEAKVEPLPFETWNDIWDASVSQYLVRCDRCGMTTRLHDTEVQAVTAWNRAMGAKDNNVPNKFATDTNAGDKERTAKVETVEKPNVYKCSECGQYFHSTSWGSPVEYCSRCGCRLDWDEDIPMEYFESGGR